ARGYQEGRNLVIERRTAGTGNPEAGRLARDAEELVSLGVEVIVVNDTTSAQTAGDATESTPIVTVAAGNPEKNKLTSDIARPTRNITGLTTRDPKLAEKRLEVLREFVPGLSRIAVLYDDRNPSTVDDWEVTAEAAAGISLDVTEIS